MSFKSTAYKAFDLVVVHISVSANSVITNEPLINNVFQVGSEFPFVWLQTKGKAPAKNLNTQEVRTGEVGDCTLTKKFSSGEWMYSFLEDTEGLCISPFVNDKKLPLKNSVSEFVLFAGNEIEIPQNTKLFLGDGKLEVNGKIISSPNQLKFSNGPQTVKALTNCFGFYVL